ncbi:MAG: family 10 glycosylhydrolase [Spirulinaceae cyanobacterium SM2_1_0]|nr:family 10 glycosylhydrolase [Spirulinaceae cyanobacterium SM2_1_0]
MFHRQALPRWLRALGLILLAVLSGWMALSRPLPGVAQTRLATDLRGYWAEQCVQEIVQRGVMTTFGDGTFRPNLPVTRGEFADIIVKAFPDAPAVRQYSRQAFVDIPQGYWAGAQIRRAFETNFLSGYPERRFAPLEDIPRVQVYVAIASGLNYYLPSRDPESLLAQTYIDAPDIPGYARDVIAAATEEGLVVSFPSARQLDPNRIASRGEIAAAICQATGSTTLVPAQYVAVPGSFPLSPDEPFVPTSAAPAEPPVAAAAVGLSRRGRQRRLTADRDAVVETELRGVWLTNVDSDVLFDRRRLATAIDELRSLNFNTLYPTVWNWGHTLYPSAVAKAVIGTELDPEPGLQGRDMLQEVIERGRARAMAVIPWFEFGFMAPADSELARRHPEWLTTRQNGDRVWVEGGVHERVWLNPLHPEVQQFIIDLVVELVRNYEIDGIQFDDHFGYPSDFGYDDLTVQLYRQEHSGRAPTDAHDDPAWIRWRADKITEFMARLFAAIKAEKNEVIVSLSPNPQDFSLNAYLLDWHTWERRGLIEELVVQVYRNDLATFGDELVQRPIQQAKTNVPVAIGVLAGLRSRSVPVEQIRQQVDLVRDKRFSGVSFFFYEGLWNYAEESPATRRALFRDLFRRAKPHPSLYRGWQPKPEPVAA